jgi:hypothetical protein
MARIPNREADLARPRSRKGGERRPISRGVAAPTTQPSGNQEWEPAVTALWLAMDESGQSDYYQASDWAYARVVLDELDRIRRSSRPSAEALRAVLGGLDRLLLTEGERRRARIELEAPAPEGESAAVVAIAQYRADLGLGVMGEGTA